MIDIINNQTKKYQGYTDRYLVFKAEFRKEIPYQKPTIEISVDVKAALGAIKKLGCAFTEAMVKLGNLDKGFTRLKYAVLITERQKFMARVKVRMRPSLFKKHYYLISKIEEHHRERFLLMLHKEIDWEGAFFALDEVWKLERKLNLDTNDILELLPEFKELYYTINHYEK